MANSFGGVVNNISYRNGGYGFASFLSCSSGNAVFGGYNCAYANNQGATNIYSGCYYTSLGAYSITIDPQVAATNYYRFTSTSSPCINAGNPSYLDPDGTPSDMGAYGGPDAANWWRSPLGGPTVQNVTVQPPQVAPGGTVTIRATATTQ